MDDHDSDIEARLAAIENNIKTINAVRNWLVGVLIFLLAQLGTFIWSYAQLSRDVENINTTELRTNTATALQVLGQHGEEFRLVDSEMARLRGQIDSMRTEIDRRTKDRFYRADGDRLERRIERIEERLK